MIERTLVCSGKTKVIEIPQIFTETQIEDLIISTFDLEGKSLSSLYIPSINKMISFQQLKSPQISKNEILEVLIGSINDLPPSNTNPDKLPYQTFGIITKPSKENLPDLKNKKNIIEIVPLIRDTECKRLRDNNKSFILFVIKEKDLKTPIYVASNFLEVHSSMKFAYKVDIKNDLTEIKSFYNSQSSIQTKPENGFLTEENITDFLKNFTTRTNRFTFGQSDSNHKSGPSRKSTYDDLSSMYFRGELSEEQFIVFMTLTNLDEQLKESQRLVEQLGEIVKKETWKESHLFEVLRVLKNRDHLTSQDLQTAQGMVNLKDPLAISKINEFLGLKISCDQLRNWIKSVKNSGQNSPSKNMISHGNFQQAVQGMNPNEIMALIESHEIQKEFDFNDITPIMALINERDDTLLAAYDQYCDEKDVEEFVDTIKCILKFQKSKNQNFLVIKDKDDEEFSSKNLDYPSEKFSFRSGHNSRQEEVDYHSRKGSMEANSSRRAGSPSNSNRSNPRARFSKQGSGNSGSDINRMSTFSPPIVKSRNLRLNVPSDSNDIPYFDKSASQEQLHKFNINMINFISEVEDIDKNLTKIFTDAFQKEENANVNFYFFYFFQNIRKRMYDHNCQKLKEMLLKDLPEDKIDSFCTDMRYKKDYEVFAASDSNDIENAKEFTKRRIYAVVRPSVPPYILTQVHSTPKKPSTQKVLNKMESDIMKSKNLKEEEQVKKLMASRRCSESGGGIRPPRITIEGHEQDKASIESGSRSKLVSNDHLMGIEPQNSKKSPKKKMIDRMFKLFIQESKTSELYLQSKEIEILKGFVQKEDKKMIFLLFEFSFLDDNKMTEKMKDDILELLKPANSKVSKHLYLISSL